MSTLRRILSINRGDCSPDTWLQAAHEEAKVTGKPRACDGCPLRPGGEWEAGCSKALAEMPESSRPRMKRWGCHEADRPCAGMQRLLKAANGA